MNFEILGQGRKYVETFLLCRVHGQCHCPSKSNLSCSALQDHGPSQPSSPGHHDQSISVITHSEIFLSAQDQLVLTFQCREHFSPLVLATLQFPPWLRTCELPAGSIAELRNSIPSCFLTQTVAGSPTIKEEQNRKYRQMMEGSPSPNSVPGRKLWVPHVCSWAVFPWDRRPCP